MALNPWLEISVNDYINHMSSPEVRQYQMIKECFKTALYRYNPQTIFVPGCTVGNGFEHIDWQKIKKVVALDINNEYLNVLRSSYPEKEKLQIVNDDLLNFTADGSNFDLIFAALLFEYINVQSSLKKIKELMHKTSTLFSILQLPSKVHSKVTRTKYKSLEKLNSLMHLVDVNEFHQEIIRTGLYIKRSEQKTLKSGKSFSLIEAGLAT